MCPKNMFSLNKMTTYIYVRPSHETSDLKQYEIQIDYHTQASYDRSFPTLILSLVV